MRDQLSITLDAADVTEGAAQLEAGDLLTGSIDVVSDSRIYLNSITVLLKWSLTLTPGKAITAAPNEDIEVVSGAISTLPIDPDGRRPDRVSRLNAGNDTVKIVDQRVLSSDTTPDFVHEVVPGTAYSWRFTMQTPRDPWTYGGRLFRIAWEIEATADVGRGLRRSISKFLQMWPNVTRELILLAPHPETP